MGVDASVYNYITMSRKKSSRSLSRIVMSSCMWKEASCILFYVVFGRPFAKNASPYAIAYRTVVCLCLSVLSVLSVCDVGVLWPNVLTNQDETWHAGTPRPWPHCVTRGPSSPSHKGAQPPNFRPIPVSAKWLNRSRFHLVWR